MYPEQPPAPNAAGNNYDFIMSPQKPQRRSLLGGDPFITKVVVILGGTVLLMIVTAVVVNLFFGGKNNVELLVGLTQTEQEIARLGAEGENSATQDIKGAAANTTLVLSSHQKALLDYMGEHGREVKNDELNLKKDAETDTTLENARQSSTFDTTYTATMRTLLEDYADELRSAYDASSSQSQKEILNQHYGEVLLLLKQWPA